VATRHSRVTFSLMHINRAESTSGSGFPILWRRRQVVSTEELEVDIDCFQFSWFFGIYIRNLVVGASMDPSTGRHARGVMFMK